METEIAQLEGATIQAIEDREGESGAHELTEADKSGEVLAWAFLVFVTNKGHVTLDWRNDSNGYYSGWINLIIK